MLTTQQALKKYGTPTETGAAYLTTIVCPYPLRIAWDIDTTTTRVRCHKDIANKLLAVFNDLLSEYGYSKIKELGIDLYGGCFNYRNMRGGSAWS